jgi:hypothetical protein
LPSLAFPLDPREPGVDVQRRLVDRLREDKLLSAETFERPDGGEAVRIVAQDARGGKWLTECDPARNHLPTRVGQLIDGDLFNTTTEVTYREVIPGKAWFPIEATKKIFFPGVRTPDAPGWRALLIHQLRGDLVLNEEIPDSEFEQRLPAGTEVRGSRR